MDPLFFIAIIVIFSILDSIARKRRTGTQPPEVPPERESPRTEERLGVPTYDAGPSYDEIGIEEEEEEERERAQASPESSETLVPRDLWEEIAGLMTTAQKSREPKPSARSSSQPPTRRSGARPTPPLKRPRLTRRPRALEPRRSAQPSVSHGRAIMPGERVHQSHREYGTDPSERSRSEQDGLDPLARSLGADESTARQQLRGRSRHALRQAIILQEVLGPPAALRPDRFPD